MPCPRSAPVRLAEWHDGAPKKMRPSHTAMDRFWAAESEEVRTTTGNAASLGCRFSEARRGSEPPGHDPDPPPRAA
jgi:hypothetical protein